MSSTNGRSTNAVNTNSQIARSGGDVVCDAILEAGVDVVFGMPGGASLPFYDALYRYQDRIRHVLIRHEQAAGFAANGYARALSLIHI